MLVRLGWKDFEKNRILNLIVILLLIMVFLAASSASSAVEIKMKKYREISKYMNKKGVYLQSEYIQNYETEKLFRDENELKEFLSGAEDVLSVAEIWETYIDGKKINTWVYSSEVVDMLSPDMEEGRWFSGEDNHAQILKAVVSHNMDGLKVGDVVRLKSGLCSDAVQKVEIIGVMKDNAGIYYQNRYTEAKNDYRDCFYTYNYNMEGNMPLMILSDRQILGNQARGWFEYLNYRLNSETGFQKQIKAGTLITYPDSIADDVIDADIERLRIGSMIIQRLPLPNMKKIA